MCYMLPFWVIDVSEHFWVMGHELYACVVVVVEYWKKSHLGSNFNTIAQTTNETQFVQFQ